MCNHTLSNVPTHNTARTNKHTCSHLHAAYSSTQRMHAPTSINNPPCICTKRHPNVSRQNNIPRAWHLGCGIRGTRNRPGPRSNREATAPCRGGTRLVAPAACSWHWQDRQYAYLYSRVLSATAEDVGQEFGKTCVSEKFS